MAKRLAIVGAGAKAAAIMARAAVLRVLSPRTVPDLLIIEEDQIGAAWSGNGRFSNGFLELCTPGEKDIGFPYIETTSRHGAKSPIGPALFAKFSWSAFLVATGAYSDWVDRSRPHPSHKQFAQYLQWCFEVAQQTTIPARVTEILSSGTNSWEIRYQNSGTTASLKVDGVVLTGAGKAREIPLLGSPPGGRILNAETFWPHRADVCDLREGTIAVAGDGGAAGAIIAWLVEVMEERSVAIQSISPMGTMLPRGDGYSERRRFSDPSDWSELTHEHRNAILRRTDAGVISLKNKAVIDQAKSVIYTSGKVMSAEWTGDDVRLNIEYDKKRQPDVPCDYFINAIGFDQWTLLDLVKHSKIASILERTSGADLRKQIEANMLPDLSLPPIAGVGSGLHVPSLAAFQHGPGMGNLGSLGLMATAILNSYLD